MTDNLSQNLGKSKPFADRQTEQKTITSLMDVMTTNNSNLSCTVCRYIYIGIHKVGSNINTFHHDTLSFIMFILVNFKNRYNFLPNKSLNKN